MSEILKTEALVLGKLDHGDTSKIAHFYSKEYGKISAIIKGGRLGESKIGRVIDPLNVLQLVFYRKEHREMHLVSQADLVSYFSAVHEDFETLKYSLAVLELLQRFTPETDPNPLLYRGSVKILKRFEEHPESAAITFLRYMLFFLKEIGYELPFEHCSGCQKPISEVRAYAFGYDKGILCPECEKQGLFSTRLSAELFLNVHCLKSGKLIEPERTDSIKNLFSFIMMFAQKHVNDFQGLRSLK